MEKRLKYYTEDQYNLVKKKILNKRKKPVCISHRLVREIFRRNIDKNRKNLTYTKMINRLIDEICPYKFKAWLSQYRDKEIISNMDDQTDYFWASEFRYFKNKKPRDRDNHAFVFQISNKNIAFLLRMTYPERFQWLDEELEIDIE